MPANDIKAALRWVWRIVSAVVLVVLLAPWLLSPQRIAALTPKCEWKTRYGRECFFCGMTTAFIDIAEGRFRDAERSNRGSIPLYAGFLVNEVVLVLFVTRHRTVDEKNSASC